ncbi:MAG: DUF2202 domain-containing protein [Gammaproteobacteria bacterium]|nr:DUF2202 domain-containing protein [Gammaproteobacteria bacterium]
MAAGRNASTYTSSTELSAAEISCLQFMREEEKLARDVYLTLEASCSVQRALIVP